MKRDRKARGIPAAPGEPQGGRPERGERTGQRRTGAEPCAGRRPAGPKSPGPGIEAARPAWAGAYARPSSSSWARRPSTSRSFFRAAGPALTAGWNPRGPAVPAQPAAAQADCPGSAGRDPSLGRVGAAGSIGISIGNSTGRRSQMKSRALSAVLCGPESWFSPPPVCLRKRGSRRCARRSSSSSISRTARS